MPAKKKVEEAEIATEATPVETPKKKPAKKAKKEEKAAPAEKTFAKPTLADFDVILEPIITEKTMALLQNANKATVKVAAKANKIEIKEAFQRLYQAPVTAVKVSNVASREKSRGGRYKGSVPGYKKAVITIAEGSAIDLFKE